MWIYFGCEYSDCPPDGNYASKQVNNYVTQVGEGFNFCDIA